MYGDTIIIKRDETMVSEKVMDKTFTIVEWAKQSKAGDCLNCSCFCMVYGHMLTLAEVDYIKTAIRSEVPNINFEIEIAEMYSSITNSPEKSKDKKNFFLNFIESRGLEYLN
jgi:hypothetical protein